MDPLRGGGGVSAVLGIASMGMGSGDNGRTKPAGAGAEGTGCAGAVNGGWTGGNPSAYWDGAGLAGAGACCAG